ncbi:MAG TPA: M20 family metallo-hydrolase [Candidatus Acidoferrum sp.]|nr:M20 family metallo-hydrolase [Candidatus Acidoferrum sp.]
MKLAIDRERLVSEIQALGQISEVEPPVVTRIVFTEADLRARAWVIAKCKEAGLAVRVDPVGNTFVRWTGADASAPAVGTGSHIDAIPNAGKYDGVVGVLGGLEAIRSLRNAGFQPKRSIELLIFTSEEPTRFGVGCLGSRMLSGTLNAESAAKLRDAKGDSLENVRRKAGFEGSLNNVRLAAGHYHAFVELHIEQGPILERERISLGIVERIAAPASANIFLEGAGGHAGGVLMPERKDALCAGSELILEVERAARSTGAIDTVATVGICDLFPGAVNSIPSKVRLSLDVRDTDLARRDGVMNEIALASKRIAEKRNVSIRTEILNADAPAECAPEVILALAESCGKHKLDCLPMVSRAYHDSLFVSRIASTGMLFIPCFQGYSHRPDEYAAPEDIEKGTLVLAETLAKLAS